MHFGRSFTLFCVFCLDHWVEHHSHRFLAVVGGHWIVSFPIIFPRPWEMTGIPHRHQLVLAKWFFASTHLQLRCAA